MITETLDEFVERMVREIANAEIREPGDGESVGPCHWSRTGWAVKEADGSCTCKPASVPSGVRAA